MRFAIKGLLLCVALALAVPGTAGADTIISTLGNVGMEAGTDVNAETNAAEEVVMGPQSETLQSVTLDLLAGNGTATVSILNDSTSMSNSPGSLALSLGTITPTGSGYALYTLTPPSSLTLTAGTNYWVEVTYDHTVSPTAPGPWAFADPPPPFGTGVPPTGSGTTPYFAISADDGASWAVFATSVDGPYILQVNGVPEPSTLFSATIAVLFGIGVKIHRHCKRKADATA